MLRFFGENLTCVRGGRAVFANLSFSVEGGGALVLRGPNGSGKSSLLRMMAGLLAPVGGTLAWAENETVVPVHEDPEYHHRHFHFVSHADAVKPAFTAAENVDFWAGLRPVSGDPAQALAALGISDLADVPGRFLSAGQKRRVNLARILAAPADMWLMDEPTTALDSDAIAAFQDAMSRHREAGGIVVASTHVEIGLGGAQVIDLADYQPGEPEFD